MDNSIATAFPIKNKLIAIQEEDSLDVAFNKLFGKSVLSAPVLNAQGRPIGVISLIDIVVFAVNLAKTSQTLVQALGLPVNHPELFIDFSSIPDRLFEHPDLQETFNIDAPKFIANFSSRNPLTTFKPTDSVSTLLNSFTLLSKSRRVAVTEDGTPNSKLVNYITQTDVLKFASENGLLNEFNNKTLGELNLGAKVVHSIGANDRIIEAFKLFITENIEAVPVVSENGQVVGNVSAYDIRAIDASGEAIEVIYWNWPQYREKMATLDPVVRPITVKSTATVGEVLDILLKNKIHRVYVVDDQEKPIGVVSMTDLISLLN